MEAIGVDPAATGAILAWYDARGRSLPFRGPSDPYAILVSEVMAQQTQVGRVGPAWSAFMDRFPTLASLAKAPTAEVLRAWRGLGYNRRALNLQRAARAIVDQHGGRLPGEVAALERLPGIGPYTARAVAAIAFGRPVAAVDTNVRRVLLRLTGADGAMSARRLQALADAAVTVDRPADWTHAVMDLGATVCRASGPRCDECPARAWCRSASAQPSPSARRTAPPRPAYAATGRWLRGTIVDRLRELRPDEWARVADPIGGHGAEAVRQAVAALERDGLLERHPRDPARARLPAG